MTVEYFVKPVTWDSPEAELIRSIRLRVFVEEQHFPREEEFDLFDPQAYHVLGYGPDGKAYGTGRLYPDIVQTGAARIGRMAVLQEARGKGCGTAILWALIEEARRRGYRRVILSAQVSAMSFYARCGFTPYGPHFLDANVPHQDMQLFIAGESGSQHELSAGDYGRTKD